MYSIVSAVRADVAGFDIQPLRGVLTAKQSVVSFKVTNQNEQAAIFQMTLSKWSQKEGVDVYEDTKDLIVTPPLINVPAKGSQIVRIGLRRAPDENKEFAYRVYFQEVLPAKEVTGTGPQLNVILKIGIPVFVAPLTPIVENVEATLKNTDGNKYQLYLKNTGNAHLKITKILLETETSDNKKLLEQETFTYLLPGEGKEWLFDNVATAQDRSLELVLVTDARTIRQKIQL